MTPEPGPVSSPLIGTIAPPELMAGESPEDVLRWAYEAFPRTVIVASFQAESSVLIDTSIGCDKELLSCGCGGGFCSGSY